MGYLLTLGFGNLRLLTQGVGSHDHNQKPHQSKLCLWVAAVLGTPGSSGHMTIIRLQLTWKTVNVHCTATSTDVHCQQAPCEHPRPPTGAVIPARTAPPNICGSCSVPVLGKIVSRLDNDDQMNVSLPGEFILK